MFQEKQLVLPYTPDSLYSVRYPVVSDIPSCSSNTAPTTCTDIENALVTNKQLGDQLFPAGQKIYRADTSIDERYLDAQNELTHLQNGVAGMAAGIAAFTVFAVFIVS